MNSTAFFYITGIILACVLLVIFSKPIGKFLKLIVRCAFGTVCIIMFNFISQVFGFFIGVNALTAITLGFLGAPGFVMLLMLKLILN